MYVVERTDDEQCVARIRGVSPSDIELFALRLLLMNHGSSSYEDTRTFNGQQYGTYRETAIVSGLLADGSEFDIAFQEAVQIYSTPSKLRRLVVTLYQQGADPEKMAVENWKALCRDIYTGDDQQRKQEMYRRVVEISDRHGGRLLRDHSFFSQHLQQNHAALTEANRATSTRDARVVRNSSTSQSRYATLKPRQRQVIDTVIAALQQRQALQERTSTPGNVLFVQGSAGTGKTYVLKLLRDIVESEGMLAEMTATTGIAASLYEGDRTLHSLLGLGVGDRDSTSGTTATVSKYGPRSQRGELLHEIQLLVFYEASMLSRKLFELMDALLKDLHCSGMENPPPFGGLTIVLSGDYSQLLPVVPQVYMEAEPSGNVRPVYTNILNELPWKSDMWTLCSVQVLYLTEQVRQANDPAFASLLRSIGRNTISNNAPLPLRSTGGMRTAYQFLWKWLTTRRKEDVDVSKMLIASTNQLVDEHKVAALDLFPGDRFTLPSATTVQPDGLQNSQPDVINTFVPEFAYQYAPTGVPPHNLDLKTDVQVMVIRNGLHPAVVNGKLFVVMRVDHFTMQVARFDENRQVLERKHLHRIDFEFSFADIRMIRKQFPIRLAFAATVLKGQDKTFDGLLVDMRSNFFCTDQLYFTLSRVRRNDHVLLLYDLQLTSANAHTIHPMPVAIANSVLPEAIPFCIPPQL